MLNERIKEARTMRDMTQEELGSYLGVGKSTINKYENGKIKLTSDKVETLAKALNVSPGYLMGWTNDPYESPDAAPTRASITAKLEGVLKQAGYLTADEQLTPELLSSISVALETAIEIYRKNHQ